MPVYENRDVAGYLGTFEGKAFILCSGCVDYPSHQTEDGVLRFFEWKSTPITKGTLEAGEVYVCDACGYVLRIYPAKEVEASKQVAA